jgi:recombination directionality factor gp3-like protein
VAIRDLQSALAELGRIRLGQRVPKRDGSGVRPDKLDRFKFTSGAEHLVTEIAALYGGEVGPFTGEGVRGKQFQVVTDTNIIPVYLPQQRIDPFYEQWKGGVCTRRCDGERDHIHDNPCDCNPDKRECKPTTRVNVMLADVPGIGVWRLETHGIYAAMEMSQLAMLLAGVQIPIPGRLLLESRLRKFFNRKEGKVETRDYYVPVIIIDSVTARQVQIGGDALTQAVQMSSGAMAVEAAPQARAIEAAPAAKPQPDPALIERGLSFIAGCTPEQMADARERIRRMGDPQALLDAFQARLGEQKAEEVAKARAIQEELNREAAQSATVRELEAAWSDEDREQAEYDAARENHDEGGPAAPEPEGPGDGDEAPQDPPVDRGDVSTAMGALLQQAARLRMNTGALDAEIRRKFDMTRFDVTAAQLDELTAELKERTR